MGALLAHPGFQAGAAPLVAGLLAAALGYPLRLSGLAAGAGFATFLYFTGNLSVDAVSVTRRLAMAGVAAILFGAIADLGFKPTRGAGVVLGALFGFASLWVFWPVLSQMPVARATLHGIGIAALVLSTVALSITLHSDAVRAGAAGQGLGLGAGIGAMLGGSSQLGWYGVALGAGCGGFLLLVLFLGKRIAAGASLTLAASVIASLVGAAGLLLARLPWYALALLPLVPLAVRLPIPERSAPALQVFVASLYALAAAAGLCFVSSAWPR